jgi:DeoR/GlpR family transcriptional regulator of sugar metabolism
MFIQERQNRILQIIRDRSRVEVKELSEEFTVSEDTIRRDLRIMEQKGLLDRTYGGAILPMKFGDHQVFNERREIHRFEKENIGALAASFISDKDSVFLDGSTTVEQMISHLTKFEGLTAITNSAMIAYQLINLQARIALSLIGGIVSPHSANVTSAESIEAIRSLCVDKVFLGICSVLPGWGIGTGFLEDLPIKKALLETGKSVYILADSHKIGHKALGHVGMLLPEHTVLTDDGLSATMRKEFRERNLTVLTPRDLNGS